MPIVFRCHPGIGPVVTGPALVANDGFSARYDLDRKAGLFSRPTHALYGQSYVGKVLALATAKGGVATAWMLRAMAERGIVPLALLFNRVNPIMAQAPPSPDLPCSTGSTATSPRHSAATTLCGSIPGVAR
jgi:predicted aconitase with swiveling domain